VAVSNYHFKFLNFMNNSNGLLSSVSMDLHMRRGEELFSSAIIQSGLLPLCGVLSVEQYQVIYDKFLAELKIPEDLSPRERLLKLIEMDSTKLTDAMQPICVTPVITFSPCDDHVLIDGPMPDYSSYSDFSTPDWCQRVMMGDVANECVIWNKGFRSLDAPAFIARIKSFLKDDQKAQKLIDLYDITPDMDRNKTFYKIEKFTTDGLYLALHWVALRANPQIYAYRFDVPSPFSNDWQGLAHHSLDNVYIWSLLKHLLPAHQQPVSAEMTRAWLAFANGHEPWARFDANSEFMVFEDAKWGLRTVQEDAARGYAVWEEIDRAGLMRDFGRLADELCMRHEEICDPESKPRMLVVEDFADLGISAGNQPGGLRREV
jgi:carboxylesterase type B